MCMSSDRGWNGLIWPHRPSLCHVNVYCHSPNKASRSGKSTLGVFGVNLSVFACRRM